MNLKLKSTTSLALALTFVGNTALAGMDEARAFLDAEIGDLSSLSRAEQEAEMQFFVDAAKPFAGMEIKVVSETITTHEYESQVLAPAFTAITGIKITHDLIGEVTLSKNCKHKCNRAKTSMMPMSTIQI